MRPPMSDDELGLYLLGWLAGMCRSDMCPIRVDHVDAAVETHISGSAHGNVLRQHVNSDGSMDHHFDVVTLSGLRFRVTVEEVP